VQRAKDFNSKKEKIKQLKQKVADRNKDEFYFGMVNKQTKVCNPRHANICANLLDRAACIIRIEAT
jgi:hypothetical protein